MFFRYNWPAVIWALFILLLCSFPGDAIPVVNWLEYISFDKLVHASIFFIQQILLMRGFLLQKNFRVLRQQYILITLSLCVGYGASLEIMQRYFFLSRSGDIADFVANCAGCLLALPLFNRLKNKIII